MLATIRCITYACQQRTRDTAAAQSTQSFESGPACRLSERNVVELVLKLLELQKIELVFTQMQIQPRCPVAAAARFSYAAVVVSTRALQDGREYVTPQALEREIKDELLAAGGRIGVVPLADALNMDLQKVQTVIDEITRDSGIKQLQGELITPEYVETMCEVLHPEEQASHAPPLSMNVAVLALRHGASGSCGACSRPSRSISARMHTRTHARARTLPRTRTHARAHTHTHTGNQ